MSDNSHKYRDGLERGKSGKAGPDPLIQFDILETKADREARRRGYEDGLSAAATAEAIAEKLAASTRNSSASEAPSWESSGPSEPMMPSTSLLMVPGSLLIALFTWPLTYISAFIIGSFKQRRQPPVAVEQMFLTSNEVIVMFLSGPILVSVFFLFLVSNGKDANHDGKALVLQIMSGISGFVAAPITAIVFQCLR